VHDLLARCPVEVPAREEDTIDEEREGRGDPLCPKWTGATSDPGQKVA